MVPRGQKGAVISGKEEMLARAKLLFDQGAIETISSKKLQLKADTICVHGDNEAAVELIKSLHQLKNDY